MSLIKLRRRLLQLQLHYWRHVYTLIRLWLCACINKSNGSQFKSAHYGNVFASVFMPLILLFSASFPEDAVNSFLSSFLFFLILTSLSYAKKKTTEPRFATELLRHDVCMKSIYAQKTLYFMHGLQNSLHTASSASKGRIWMIALCVYRIQHSEKSL